MTAILVTGSTGFIGSRLTRRLAAEGLPLLLMQRRRTEVVAGAEILLVPEWTPVAIDSALKGRRLESVFHLAAYGVAPSDRDPHSMMRVNLAATLALVEAAARAGAKAMLIAGSSAEYRAPTAPSPLSEDAPLEIEKLYGASKAAAGIAALALARSLGLPLAVARLFNVFGPGEAAHRLLPSLVRGFAARKRIALSPGQQVRDFVHVDDAVAAFCLLADTLRVRAQLASGVYNVASGVGTSVRQFVETAALAAGADPALLGFGDIPMRPDDVPWLIGNSHLIASRASWSPRLKLADGIALTLDDAATGIRT